MSLPFIFIFWFWGCSGIAPLSFFIWIHFLFFSLKLLFFSNNTKTLILKVKPNLPEALKYQPRLFKQIFTILCFLFFVFEKVFFICLPDSGRFLYAAAANKKWFWRQAKLCQNLPNFKGCRFPRDSSFLVKCVKQF